MHPIGALITIGGGNEPQDDDELTMFDAPIQHPRSVAVDSTGDVFFADESNQIRKIDSSGTLSEVAGNGNYGSEGDGGPPLDASFYCVSKIRFDHKGNMLVVDSLNHKVRIISAGVNGDGVIRTVAGNGVEGYVGDGGPAIEAQLNEPLGLDVDEEGNIYIADYNNHRIRKVDSRGQISTIAGNGNSGFTTGDGDALNAEVGRPKGVCVGINGDIYFSSGCRICRLSSNGLSTLAGTGGRGYTGDGGKATSAQIGSPTDVVVDRNGFVFFSDSEHHVVRRIDHSGIITTIAGTGSSGFNGDGEGIKTELAEPHGLSLDLMGNLFIADCDNDRLRKLCGAVTAEEQTLEPNQEEADEEFDFDLLEQELLGTPSPLPSSSVQQPSPNLSKLLKNNNKKSRPQSIQSNGPPGENDLAKGQYVHPPPFEDHEGKGISSTSWTPGSPYEYKEAEIHTKSFQEYIRRTPEGIPGKGSDTLLDLFKTLNIDERYLIPFVEHEVEVSDIVDLTTEDLQSLIPVIGPRNRILKHIESLRSVQTQSEELDELKKKVEEYESLQQFIAVKEREILDKEAAFKQQENLSLIEHEDGIIKKGGKEYRLVEISEVAWCQKCSIM